MKKTTKTKVRTQLLKKVLQPKSTTKLGKALKALEEKANPDTESLSNLLKDHKLSAKDMKKIERLESIAAVLDSNEKLVKSMYDKMEGKYENLREVALNCGQDDLRSFFHANQIPKEYPGDTQKEKEAAFSKELEQKIFKLEPTATVQRLLRNKAIDLPDKNILDGVASFFEKYQDLNIREHSILRILTDPAALEDTKEEHRPQVETHLKTLQRITAISPDPKTVEVLFNKKVHSASQISNMSEGNFVKRYGGDMGEQEARQVYRNALAVKMRNEQALMSIKEIITPSGVSIIANSLGQIEDIMQPYGKDGGVSISYETLFGSADFCECGHCNSVFSPAAYFVELLQFLRNNNLDPENPHTGQLGYLGTPLEHLFWRRPDLKCLELTCENAFTILPYIDLSNEIMECYVAHNNNKAPTIPPHEIKVDIETFNTDKEGESSTLLVQPQNIHKKAYCILSEAVFPFCLPYSQPVDAIRIFLDHLITSRFELMESYRPFADGQTLLGEDITTPPSAEAEQMTTLEKQRWDRALCAEQLLMTEQEYVILTKEAFASKAWYETYDSTTYTDTEYHDLIELKSVRDHYFHVQDTTPTEDLQLVKTEFLPRTGLSYMELVDLLKTFYINPYQPLGEVKNILEILNIPYRTLQSRVIPETDDPEVRYAELIKFIHHTYYQQQLERSKNPDPCTGKIDLPNCLNKCDVETWVYYYFEKLGRMIVLESNQDMQFSYPGFIRRKTVNENNESFQVLSNGNITDVKNNMIGQINEDLKVVWARTPRNNDDFILYGLDGKIGIIKYIREGIRPYWEMILDDVYRDRPAFMPVDTCDISKVNIRHLDGSALNGSEWDKIQRFIRLWKKLGWSMQQLDSVILGLNANIEITVPYPDLEPCVEDRPDGTDDCGCSKLTLPKYQIGSIDSHLICQIASLTQVHDRLNINLQSLLSFWSDIETGGEASLYSKLFLKKNLRSLDPVFEANGVGEYLSDDSVRISEHIPAIMAGLNIKADDITRLDVSLSLNDEMTLSNISAIYRHQLFARFLGIKILMLLEAKALFGDPFVDSKATLTFLDQWQKMEDAGLDLRQLRYIILDQDDALRPLGISKIDQLKLSLDIFEGIQAVDTEHGDITEEDFTTDLLRSKLELVYDASSVDKMILLVEGKTVYQTNAPDGLIMDPAITPPSKLQYIDDGANSIVRITGILTATERADAAALNSDPLWADALDRIDDQLDPKFTETFFQLLLNLDADAAVVRGILLGEDVDHTTIITKGLAILEYFLPILRTRLKDQLVVDLLSDETKLPIDQTDNLVRNILTEVGSTISLLETFKAIGINTSPPAPGSFNGYLVPQRSDDYTFVVQADTGGNTGTIEFNGSIINLTQLPDPTNVYVSEPISLISGVINTISLSGFDPDLQLLKWKRGSNPVISIPESILIPDHLSANFDLNFKRLQKASIMIDNYAFAIDEVSYLHVHSTDFDDLDFNEITHNAWLRLHDYNALKEALPESDLALIDFFKWAKYHVTPIPETEIVDKIHELTHWDTIDIGSFIQRAHFNVLDQEKLVNEISLSKVLKAKAIQDKVNIDVPSLFEYAKPSKTAQSTNKEDFDHFWKISNHIQGILKARYSLDDWEEVIKPLNDTLRTNQRNALIPYLLNQQALREWGVTDADSLYEFFLIDVQMEACMETSRIKQAISSTQLFIQRIFLDLERENISNEDFDEQRKRWAWMNQYRIWEANRKVFLYPENWMRSELRDDKSPFYKELESELLQKDINPDMVKDTLKTYLYKLDEVADMKVVGIYVKEDNGDLERIHVVSRTRSAPHFFYYRKYERGNWYAWEKIQVDIPSYDFERDNRIISNGAYVIPVEFNNRLFVFFPQFVKKVIQPDHGSDSFEDMASQNINVQRPREMYEIKMAFTERKSESWSQKIISEEALYRGREIHIDFPPISIDVDDLTEIQKYEFRLEESSGLLNFKIYHNNYELDDIGPFDYFSFDGRKISKPSNTVGYPGYSILDNFQYLISSNSIKSVNKNNFYFDNNDQQLYSPNALLFKHDFSNSLLNEINFQDLQTFFDYVNKNRITSNYRKEDFGDYINDLNQSIFHELKSAYSIYNWELFFHLPMAIAENLSKNQQFEEAMKWHHFVFNPYQEGSDANRFWKFLPFRYTNAQNYLESFFNLLQANEPNDSITEWRDDPFNPHIIARSRPSAYMKWVVMKYLDNLLDWGDYLFRQDSIESVNYASQLYILASHILGKRPQQIPKRGKIKPKTYLHLMDKLDAFSNASVEMELIFPYSNQVAIEDKPYGEEIVYANILGLSNAKYFCIPGNQILMAYWDTIADRLYKIRHCLNIEGVFRKQPLFEPPFDPGLLVEASAQGLSISSVLNDLNTPVPEYRFNYQLQKAFELCNEVKSLGNTLLSTLEKKDGEVLSLMRAKHEVGINNLVMEVRKHQLDEAQRSLDALYENRKSSVYRMGYNLKLIGEDLNKIPSETTDYNELADKVEKVLDHSGLKLISLEKEELIKSSIAARMQNAASIIETVAGMLHVVPDINVNTQPMGAGVTTRATGGSKLGPAMSTGAKVLGFLSSELSFQSSNAARKAGFTRQLQDRIQQANLAGREIKQIDKQILAQKIRIQIAEQELENQQQQIDNALEAEEYLKTKYTNVQLYSWMEEQVKSLFYQSYKMAYDLAKKVEGLYRFERGLTSTNFIQFGYWNSARDGLLSGERLYNGLKQIEIAHQETRAHDYEIANKQISLRKLDPTALLALRETGTCEFDIPEVLFDMDFPGYYKRRIKTVSFSMPCIAGPYTSISAKASLTEHSFRISKIASGGYPRKMAEDDDRFMTVNVPINAVALSSAQNDGGVFELNFRDERYMPFEGAGAISKWKLELPTAFKQFDYHTISDVIIHMSYTACEGGEQLKESANGYLSDVISDATKFPQYALFDLKHDFAQEWYKGSLLADPSTGDFTMTIMNLKDRFPYLTSNLIVDLHDIEPQGNFTLITALDNDLIENNTPLEFNVNKDKVNNFVIFIYSLNQ